jgi:hypothetical protein
VQGVCGDIQAVKDLKYSIKLGDIVAVTGRFENDHVLQAATVTVLQAWKASNGWTAFKPQPAALKRLYKQHQQQQQQQDDIKEQQDDLSQPATLAAEAGCGDAGGTDTGGTAASNPTAAGAATAAATAAEAGCDDTGGTETPGTAASNPAAAEAAATAAEAGCGDAGGTDTPGTAASNQTAAAAAADAEAGGGDAGGIDTTGTTAVDPQAAAAAAAVLQDPLLVVCKFWVNTGRCAKGDACPYAHLVDVRKSWVKRRWAAMLKPVDPQAAAAGAALSS